MCDPKTCSILGSDFLLNKNSKKKKKKVIHISCNKQQFVK